MAPRSDCAAATAAKRRIETAAQKGRTTKRIERTYHLPTPRRPQLNCARARNDAPKKGEQPKPRRSPTVFCLLPRHQFVRHLATLKIWLSRIKFLDRFRQTIVLSK